MSNKVEGKTMKPVAKRALVPKLRFPEFRVAATWNPYILEELEDLGWVELGRGNVISNQDIKALPGNYPIYSSSVKNSGLMGSYGRFMFDEELISWSINGGGDFFYRPPHKFSVTNVSGYMRLDSSHLNYLFTASQLQTLHASLTFDYQFPAHPSVIRKLYRLAIPSVHEQQKIADCLASLDELITLEAQKLATLKTHKKGLMQQLFPAEGETLPKLRFPEFREAGEWEEKSVGDFGDVVTGSTPSTVRPEFYGGSIPFVSPADISDLRFVNETKTTLTTLGFDETRPIKANSVLFVCIGSTIGKVTQNVRDCATNQQINSVIPNTKHSGGFVYYTLSLNAERIANLAGRQAVPIINKTQFSSVRLPVPKLREQERIADCFASLDDLIATQSQKLAALKTHKKWLMHQLFPSPEAAEA